MAGIKRKKIGDFLEVLSYSYDMHLIIEIRLLATEYEGEGDKLIKVNDFSYQFEGNYDLTHDEFKNKISSYYKELPLNLFSFILSRKEEKLHLGIKQKNSKTLIKSQNNYIIIGIFKTYYSVAIINLIKGILKKFYPSSEPKYFLSFCLALKSENDTTWIDITTPCIESLDATRTYGSGGVIMDTDDNPIHD